MKFYITEKQGLSSYRRGYIADAKDLTAAKRRATKMKCFQGTVVTIEAVTQELEDFIRDPENCANDIFTADLPLLSYKQNGAWVDCD